LSRFDDDCIRHFVVPRLIFLVERRPDESKPQKQPAYRVANDISDKCVAASQFSTVELDDLDFHGGFPRRLSIVVDDL
jgi:hypothetical protein